MNQRLFYTLLILICTFFCFSCHTKQDKEQKEITELADSFATRFYTWHFIEAMNFSDNDMKMHLTFLASNVSEEDLKLLLETNMVPKISVKQVTIKDAGNAIADIELHDVYMMDTIGYMAHLCPEIKQQLLIKRYGETWKVSGIK